VLLTFSENDLPLKVGLLTATFWVRLIRTVLLSLHSFSKFSCNGEVFFELLFVPVTFYRKYSIMSPGTEKRKGLTPGDLFEEEHWSI
jgi:hypothetical protein